MAHFEAFRGTTYRRDTVEPSAVIAPPYDVVGPAERALLAARSPYNAILVELPEDPSGGDRYRHAAELFASWHSAGVVEVAERPSLYLYRMTFTEEDGSVRTTNGVLGALGLDPAHTGQVLPHEQTISKDKHDRLSLLRAARTNFSPIWGLSLAEGLGHLVAATVAARGVDFSARDEDGTLHECCVVDDPAVIAAITDLVGTTPILIADGHHRYETACAYLAEEPDSPGTAAVLALVVELTEEELAVQSINRLVTGVSASELLDGLGGWFEIGPGPSDPIALREKMAANGALGLVTAEGSYLLTPTDALEQASEDDLDSSRLAAALRSVPAAEVTYQHGALEVARAVTEGRASAAVLLRPVSVAQIARTAHGGRRMPPKSTFFYPKPRTGIVFRELDAG